MSAGISSDQVCVCKNKDGEDYIVISHLYDVLAFSNKIISHMRVEDVTQSISCCLETDTTIKRQKIMRKI